MHHLWYPPYLARLTAHIKAFDPAVLAAMNWTETTSERPHVIERKFGRIAIVNIDSVATAYTGVAIKPGLPPGPGDCGPIRIFADETNNSRTRF